MAKIWRCPECERGARAPERLGRLDVRRWCLACSKRTGTLIERTIPSRDARRQARSEARTARSDRRAERSRTAEIEAKRRAEELSAVTDRAHSDGAAWLRAWIPKVVRLESLRRAFAENYPGKRWSPKIVIRQSGVRTFFRSTDDGAASERVTVPTRHYASGHAYPWEHRLVVTVGQSAADDLSTLIHELAHLAAPLREHHGPRFQVIQRDAIAELTGEPPVGWRRQGEDARVAVLQRWLNAGAQGTP